jgi:SAM-dependent methyltransferase
MSTQLEGPRPEPKSPEWHQAIPVSSDSRGANVAPGNPARRLASGISLRLLYWAQIYPRTAFVVTTFVSFFAIAFLSALVEGRVGDSIFGTWAENLAAGAVAALVYPLLALIIVRKDVRVLMSIAARAGGPNRSPILSFLTENLLQMKGQLELMQADGAVLPRYEVARWVRWCFETATTLTYVGTDSHVPSEYREIYSDYLAAHARFVKRVPQATSKRVMISTTEKLRTDRTNNPIANREFGEWHQQRPATLWQMEPFDNNQMLRGAKLQSLINTDIGFWKDEFVLLFNPVSKPGDGVEDPPSLVKLRIRFKDTSLYNESEQYVALLAEHAKELKTDLPFYSDELSANWKRFAAPEQRLKQTGPLIEGALARSGRPKGDLRVFDAATGVGFEAIFLLKQGYVVQLNEIEGSLRNAASEYAKENAVVLPSAQFSRSNWLDLDRDHQGGQFDVVLVLGNSLCHLESIDQVREAVQQFHKLLRPGGSLICDERNFAAIRDDWDTIKDDPINNFRFNQRTDRVMYLGNDVLGAPTELDGDRVIFEYWEVETNVDGSKRRCGDHSLGALSMYAFERGEMRDCLAEAGFSQVEVLCDLKACPGNDLDADADFYTYIATK